MFEPFTHFLSYGATDQQTIRELANSFNGLIVPGTVAAFQRAGTGGFVLTLSATAGGPDYVIDPRFPLFQQALRFPKKSHEALAELLGHPGLVSTATPTPDAFSDDMISTISQNWVRFNLGYTQEAQKKFRKYAERLGQQIQPQNVRLPLYVLPPYASSAGSADPWWRVSRQLFDAAASETGAPERLRVVAAKDAQFLTELLQDVSEDERAVVWVSRLNELEAAPHTLSAYASAVREASERNQRLFALYGGFFSILLSSFGLSGSSHGIGFGEYRDWIELPQSGPPPARYYLRRLHRYVSVEFAYRLWVGNRSLAECPCTECQGGPPVALDYHALMKHSVLCRTEEIQSWVGGDPGEMASRLDQEVRSFRTMTEELALPDYLLQQADRLGEHLPRWAEALRLAAE